MVEATAIRAELRQPDRAGRLPLAPSLFTWENRFSWSYAGDFADAIKERVRKVGGNITGDVCCRLAWSNYDDLDLHMWEPGNYHIYYGNKGHRSPNGGMLDVDANAGGGSSRRGTREPGREHLLPGPRRHAAGRLSLGGAPVRQGGADRRGL